VLITWAGHSDREAVQKNDPASDPGPVLRLLHHDRAFDEICLLDDLGLDTYPTWLAEQCPQFRDRVRRYPATDNLENDLKGTYEFTRGALEQIIRGYPKETTFGLLLSPGTPAAQVAMLIAAESLFETEVELFNTWDPNKKRQAGKKPNTGFEKVVLPFSLRVDMNLPARLQGWLVRYLNHRMPLLARLCGNPHWKEQQPFRGKRVLIVLHFLKNLLGFVEAAEAFGLEPALTTVFYKDYLYPAGLFIKKQLRARGYRVESAGRIPQEADAFLRPGGLPLLIIEDGGYFAPPLIRDPGLAPNVVGAVEQTQRGLWKVEAAIREVQEERFPVVTLPHSTLKKEFEPPHIGDAAVRAVQNILGHWTLRNRKAAVLGCGKIGSALICALAGQGVPVSFYDRDPVARVKAMNLCGLAARSVEEAVADAHLVFGTTGSTSITADVIRRLSSGAWLISVSSEQVEIDVACLEQACRSKEKIYLGEFVERVDMDAEIGTRYVLEDGRVVNLLADGYPINFMGFGEMPDQAADLVMSLIFLAAVELAAGSFRGRTGVLASAVDELVRKHQVAETYLEILAQGQ
jgi:S-adenosylhomocysteine hydrolase